MVPLDLQNSAFGSKIMEFQSKEVIMYNFH